MDDFTFDTDLFAEINDSQAEIFDVIEDEKFDVEEYINGDTDYWHLVGEQLVSQTGRLPDQSADWHNQP